MKKNTYEIYESPVLESVNMEDATLLCQSGGFVESPDRDESSEEWFEN